MQNHHLDHPLVLFLVSYESISSKSSSYKCQILWLEDILLTLQ
jgi:hypothetical protein